MKTPLILTPGPTFINENVRQEMSRELTNPDIDTGFYDFYKNVCEKLRKFMNTENEILIMCGEGILGLEAACCSLTEEGDRVLVIDNGIFGAGFADFVKLYGGESVFFSSDYRKALEPEALDEFLKNDSDFKYAALVHCETPSGVTNPIDKLCPILKKYGIITVVDSVSGMGGEEFYPDKWGVDIALGGSQKCLSAPVGLTFLSISDDAYAAIRGRKTPIKSFYLNLTAFDGWYEKKWFPYTMPIHLIYALDKALDNILSENSIKRHKTIASAVRYAIEKAGLEIYAQSGCSNTVTAVVLPDGIDFETVQKYILDNYGILIAGSFGYLKDKVIRIGHMGENCTYERMTLFLTALDSALRASGAGLSKSLPETFKEGSEIYDCK